VGRGGELGGERRVGWDRKGGRVGLGMGNRGRQGRDRQERKGRAGGEGGKRGIIAAPRIPTCRRLWTPEDLYKLDEKICGGT
jgi:hypothetical protein